MLKKEQIKKILINKFSANSILFKDQYDEINVKKDSILHTIEELKEDQKIGIKLFYLESKSYQQIADQTGWELKKVKSEIQNGKRRRDY